LCALDGELDGQVNRLADVLTLVLHKVSFESFWTTGTTSGDGRNSGMNVKTSSRARKLLEGWQAGLIVIVIAVLAVWVAVPRPALPDDIPLPRVDVRALSERSRLDSSRAGALLRDRPSFDVRALGEAIRLYGAADADNDGARGSLRLQQVGQAVAPALAGGLEPVLALRAFQMNAFLRELRAFEVTGQESAELRELGGGIIAMLRRSHWVRPSGGGYKLLVDRYVLEAMYRKRWNEVTGLKTEPFALSLEEHRALLAFLLTHPLVSATAGAEPRARCRSANEYMLRKVGELSSVDRTYPGGLAQGILLLRLGRTGEAVERLAAYLDRHPDGAYTLRARNALREAQQRLLEAERR
jgi:hypothetical protein